MKTVPGTVFMQDRRGLKPYRVRFFMRAGACRVCGECRANQAPALSPRAIVRCQMVTRGATIGLSVLLWNRQAVHSPAIPNGLAAAGASPPATSPPDSDHSRASTMTTSATVPIVQPIRPEAHSARRTGRWSRNDDRTPRERTCTCPGRGAQCQPSRETHASDAHASA